MKNRPQIVAEIGCNHNGDFELAKKMVQVAVCECKVDVVKFQKRCPKHLLSRKKYSSIYHSEHSYGKTYGEHREYLELNINQHRKLKELAESLGAFYSSSVWDLISAKEIISLSPFAIKISSASNNHEELVKYVARNFVGEIHVSLGMTTAAEERLLIKWLKEEGRLNDTVLYVCTSAYPAAVEDLCLLEIKRIEKDYGRLVKSIGFSGHHIGTFADVAAFMLGCGWIERHFTLDKTGKGTDHQISLEPNELCALTEGLTHLTKALRFKDGKILNSEKAQREKLKWKQNLEK